MNANITLARGLHILSCFWILALAFTVCADAIGRGMFNTPVPGTKEILQNSVVAITFLQLPLAVYSGSMLRTPILVGLLPPVLRRLMRVLAALLGAALFVGLVVASWPEFQTAYRIGEYEGEGALRVPTWPVRGILIVLSALTVIAYLWMITLDLTGRLINEEEAAGAIRGSERGGNA